MDRPDIGRLVRCHRGDRVADRRSGAHRQSQHTPHQTAGFDHAAEQNASGKHCQHAAHTHRRDPLMKQDRAENNDENRRSAEKDRRQRQTQFQDRDIVTDVKEKLSGNANQRNERNLPCRKAKETPVVHKNGSAEQDDSDDHPRKGDRDIVKSGLIQNPHKYTAGSPADAGDDRECPCDFSHHSSHFPSFTFHCFFLFLPMQS